MADAAAAAAPPASADLVLPLSEARALVLFDVYGNDRTTVAAAKISFHRLEKKTTGDAAVDKPLNDAEKGILRFMATEEHKSPFYHAKIVHGITMPICLARQWWRHHVGIDRNEVSRRYYDGPVICAVPNKLRVQHPVKKHASLPEAPENEQELLGMMNDCMRMCIDTYRKLREHKVCPEQARFVLPQSTMTTWMETGNLYAYHNLHKERSAPGAQEEIRWYAEEIDHSLAAAFPVCWKELCGGEQRRTDRQVAAAQEQKRDAKRRRLAQE